MECKIGWDKRRVQKQNKLLACVLENQIEIMRTMQAQIETFEHTRKYGADYIDGLKTRIESSMKIRI